MLWILDGMREGSGVIRVHDGMFFFGRNRGVFACSHPSAIMCGRSLHISGERSVAVTRSHGFWSLRSLTEPSQTGGEKLHMPLLEDGRLATGSEPAFNAFLSQLT